LKKNQNKHKLGVIVPYRDREQHLRKFIPNITEYLSKNNIDYSIIIVEQKDQRPFNRGKLLNIGFELLQDECDYFTFHDVDMLPLDADYSYVDKPIHIATQLSSEDYELQFPSYFGGVTLFNKDDFKTINGYSNEYFGWGFEDDDLLYRCQVKGLPIDSAIYGNESRVNYCLKFDGNNDYVEIPSTTTLSNLLEKDFTINLVGIPDKIILDENNKKDYDEYFFISRPGFDSGLSFTSFNRYKSEFWQSDEKSVSINSEISGEHWVNLTVTKKDNTLSFYMNSKLVDSKEIGDSFSYLGKPFYIGCGNPERKNSYFFNGLIADVGMWNYSFDKTTLNKFFTTKDTYTKHFSKNMVLYYDFKNIVNGRVIDLSGNDNHGFVHGAQQVELDTSMKSSIPVPFRRDGKFLVLGHKNNSWTGMSWVNKETRKNQLRFFNKVRSDLYDMNIDGLNTLRYKISEEENNDIGYKRVSVEL
jgi:hypothetical protein|tara:strand:+ start:1518 stop:2933 length:1416 start_codon:yes stop_codon:yes gene_type:complete